jgi:hypothetical protein
MNEVQRRAIETYASNRYDDLVRFKMQQQRDPDWKSGNDEPIDGIITQLEAQLGELNEGMDL